MAWLIYAVLPSSPSSLPALAGVDGATLATVRHSDLCAAVSRHAGTPTVSVAATLAFGDVVTALWARANVVPLRFGSSFGARRELLAWLDAEHGAFRTLLRLVGGCAEIGLRFALAQTVRGEHLIPGCGEGHAYLAARMRQVEATWRHEFAAHGQAERFAAALTGGYRCWRFDGVSQGFVGMTFLVPRPDVDDFVRACQRYAGEAGGPLYISGPWPPYSFAMSGATPFAAALPPSNHGKR
ncbi:GvpL/GvpF family gas vesicle protein [Paraburkholderia sp. A1RI_3L]|uniref:GvpL/GvpF family gas vesicle protein n=1 Tax=Paraburkholderia TaxID=1822464 RepID=UPI003B7B36CA